MSGKIDVRVWETIHGQRYQRCSPANEADYRESIGGYEYDSIPKSIKDSMLRYVIEHEPVGGQLQSVFENDLMTAAGTNEAIRDNLRAITMWIYNWAPSSCHGSRKKVRCYLTEIKTTNGSDTLPDPVEYRGGDYGDDDADIPSFEKGA